MACKKCASENLQKLTAELTASSRHVDEVKHPPIYVYEELLVCLDCGFSEIVIPGAELEQLRKRAPSPRRRSEIVPERNYPDFE
jgi:hypothetical protein